MGSRQALGNLLASCSNDQHLFYFLRVVRCRTNGDRIVWGADKLLGTSSLPILTTHTHSHTPRVRTSISLSPIRNNLPICVRPSPASAGPPCHPHCADGHESGIVRRVKNRAHLRPHTYLAANPSGLEEGAVRE